MFDSNCILNLKKQALKNGFSYTKFLNIEERSFLEKTFKDNDINLEFITGIPCGERSIAVFINKLYVDINCYKEDNIIGGFKIIINKNKKINHRDVLGAVLNLGISRESIGDILIGDTSYFVCLKNLCNYIKSNLFKISNYNIILEEVNLNEIPIIKINLKEYNNTVSSLRLDCLISTMFNISRNVSQELIDTNKVMVSHIICNKYEKEIKINDIISIRGLGKVKLLDINGVSRKNKIWIKYAKYI